MTTLTLRRIKNDFIVTGPDIAPAKFEGRPSDRVATLGCRQGKHIHGIKHGPEAAKRQKLCVINR